LHAHDVLVRQLGTSRKKNVFVIDASNYSEWISFSKAPLNKFPELWSERAHDVTAGLIGVEQRHDDRAVQVLVPTLAQDAHALES
jgi:hypothetical protein